MLWTDIENSLQYTNEGTSRQLKQLYLYKFTQFICFIFQKPFPEEFVSSWSTPGQSPDKYFPLWVALNANLSIARGCFDELPYFHINLLAFRFHM